MAVGQIKTFNIMQDGVLLEVQAIDLGGGQTTFSVKSLTGSVSADINAIYWNDNEASPAVANLLGFNAKSDNSLSIGSGWDGGVKLSSAGLGQSVIDPVTLLPTV